MKSHVHLLLAVGMASMFSACGDSKPEEGSMLGRACDTKEACGSEKLVCHPEVRVCIEKCDDDSCEAGKVCGTDGICVSSEDAPECSSIKPCADRTKYCSNGKCVSSEDQVECSDTKPCADGSKACVDGTCKDKPSEIVPESCTSNLDCPGGHPLCIDSRCVTTGAFKCSSDGQCGTNFVCDMGRCIPVDACTATRRCPDESGATVCQNGKCVQAAFTECSSKVACPTGKTCVAGACVTCSCASDEACNIDGTCSKRNHSDLKNINVGDACEYSPSFSFCDGNRIFSCSQVVGQEDHMTVKVRDCSADVCSTSPTDGLNCYEPCVDEGDFYGMCYGDYVSDSGTTVDLLFTQVCTRSVEGPLIWTFSEGYQTCDSVCVSGSCLTTPEEMGTSCYASSYPDKCEGDWWLECKEDNAPYVGYVTGIECSLAYGAGYKCAIDQEGYADCARPCTGEGKSSMACHTYAGGSVYSETYVCSKAQDGKLYAFTKDFVQCAHGCDAESGYCNECPKAGSTLKTCENVVGGMAVVSKTCAISEAGNLDYVIDAQEACPFGCVEGVPRCNECSEAAETNECVEVMKDGEKVTKSIKKTCAASVAGNLVLTTAETICDNGCYVVTGLCDE